MTSPKPQKTPLPGWAKALLYLAGAILIGGIIFSILDQAYTARWLRYADKLREGGVPLTFEEIEKQRTVIPDELNGALVIDGLSKQLDAVGNLRFVPFLGWEHEAINFFEGTPRYIVDASRSFMEEYRDLFDELDRLHGMPRGRFEFDLDLTPLTWQLRGLSSVGTASQLLYLQGSIHLAGGDLISAVDTVVLQVHACATLDEYPLIIGRFVQIRAETLARQSIENILRVGEIDDRVLRDFEDLIEGRQLEGRAKWEFLGERALWVGTCNDLADSKLKWSELFDLISTPYGVFWMPEMLIRTNEMRGAEMYTWLVEASDDPVALRSAVTRLNEELRALPITHVLVKTFMLNLLRTVILHIRSVAEWRCARTALSAERFRVATGRFPESLGELIPRYLDELPIDPFDGKPLRFTATDEGIVIYSVSEDESDDGGDVARSNENPRPPDVGFRLLSPKHRGLLLTEDAPPDEDD